MKTLTLHTKATPPEPDTPERQRAVEGIGHHLLPSARFFRLSFMIATAAIYCSAWRSSPSSGTASSCAHREHSLPPRALPSCCRPAPTRAASAGGARIPCYNPAPPRSAPGSTIFLGFLHGSSTASMPMAATEKSRASVPPISASCAGLIFVSHPAWRRAS